MTLDPTREAERNMRLYLMASDRFHFIVDETLKLAAAGTDVRALVDLVTEVATNCDYWDDDMDALYRAACERYPRAAQPFPTREQGEGGIGAPHLWADIDPAELGPNDAA